LRITIPQDPAAYDYDLPESAIAQTPIEPRDAARMLVDRGPSHAPEHRTVAELPELVGPGDLIVVNDTRVRRARVPARKASGGAVEVLLHEPQPDGAWHALVRPSRKVPPGTMLVTADPAVSLCVGDDLGDGVRVVHVDGDVDRVGTVPLPPYIHAPLADSERYQTVFARRSASAAAPTAGLHLTETVLERCVAVGAEVATVELVVGLDTFRPITEADLDAHPMHTEAYVVPDATWRQCEAAARVLAVGTTVVRALETAARTGELEGRSDLFIRDGFDFRVVDRLLTNFHVPRTTLLALVDAFIGPRWRALYAQALADGYRFLSFGDAMLLDRSSG
jgi:S-adenosylmethionine:tRNA ribosyltransferase-isomerase